MYAWGVGTHGQLGLGEKIDYVSSPRPVNLPENVKIVQVSCGEQFTLALSENGDIYSWGDGANGQLGLGYVVEQLEPKKISNFSSEDVVFTKISAGKEHALALSDSGDIYVWGGNMFGQLGLNHYKPYNRPQKLPSELKFVDIDAGSYHSLAVTDKGELYAWGSGFSFQNGREDRKSVLTPQRIGDDDFNIKYISAGEHSNIVITTKNRIYSWGSGGHCRLGHGNTNDESSPKLIETIGQMGLSAKKIVAGYDHALVLSENNQVYIWGSGSHGELGMGKSRRQRIPTLLEFSNNTPIKDIDIGLKVTVALTENGECYAWGDCAKWKFESEVGDIVEYPTKLDTDIKFSKIFAGKNHYLAIV